MPSPITQAVLEWLADECRGQAVTPASTKSQIMFDAGKAHILARAKQALANDAEDAAHETLHL